MDFYATDEMFAMSMPRLNKNKNTVVKPKADQASMKVHGHPAWAADLKKDIMSLIDTALHLKKPVSGGTWGGPGSRGRVPDAYKRMQAMITGTPFKKKLHKKKKVKKDENKDNKDNVQKMPRIRKHGKGAVPESKEEEGDELIDVVN